MFPLSHHLAAKAENALCARHPYQRDLSFLAGFKAHRSACRDIEPIAFRGFTIEFQRRVYLIKMVMRSHLDRPVAVVFNDHTHCFTPDIKGDAAGFDLIFTWDHQ